MPVWMPRVNEILRLIGSHNVLATPTESQVEGRRRSRPLIAKYLQGAGGLERRGAHPDLPARVGLTPATALGGRDEQYERFYLASAARNRALSHLIAPKERALALVDRFLHGGRVMGTVDGRRRRGLDRSLDRRRACSVERALPGRIAHRRRAPRRRGGGRRARGRRRGPRRARGVPRLGGARPGWTRADPAALRRGHPARARRSSPRSRRPTTARCSLGNVHRVVPRAAHNIEFFADWALKLEHTIDGPEVTNHVRYEPAGVAALITPWNAPLMLTTWKVGPALAAGNTVVVKPPEWAPLTCSLLADIAHAAGIPAGVLNVVQGIGEEAGAALVAHADVDRISFTGSTGNGASHR